MDLTDSIVPKSDQINADDLVSGPRTFTIDRVTAGSDEQPVDVHLVEMPGRPWRPSKSMRRVLVFAWGKETAPYGGRRVTLYRDPDVTFGRDKVGGIKVSHMSDLDKAELSVSLTVTRGKRAPHVIRRLPDVAPPVEGITKEQGKEIAGLFAAMNVEGDARLDYCRGLIGRPLAKSSELTKAEASQVIDALTADKDWTPDDGAGS